MNDKKVQIEKCITEIYDSFVELHTKKCKTQKEMEEFSGFLQIMAVHLTNLVRELVLDLKGCEIIIAAAYKVKSEYVCNDGGVYKTGTKERDDIYHCRIGRHHAEILHIFGDEVDELSDGFYTSYGRWVDREEAAKIALAAGQCKKPLIMGDRLDSSDVF